MTSSFEQWVLAAVNTREDPYAITIRATLRNICGESITLAPIYRALDRLEDYGYITSWMSPPTPERGGYGKRNYRIQKAGHIALKETVTTGVPVLETILANGRMA